MFKQNENGEKGLNEGENIILTHGYGKASLFNKQKSRNVKEIQFEILENMENTTVLEKRHLRFLFTMARHVSNKLRLLL